MKKVYIIWAVALLVIGLLTWSIGPAMAQDEEFQPIYKPLSPGRGDDVHGIPPGSTIHHLDNGITKVYGPDKRHILTTIESKQSSIPVPMRGLVKASHVHVVPSESKISRVGNRTKVYHGGTCILTVVNESRGNAKRPSPSSGVLVDESQPPPPASAYTGWIEYSRDRDVDHLRYFKAYWSVPEEPPDHYYWTTDYIFIAIESPDWDDILQPVLEWNAHRGHYEWTCAAWYGLDGDYYRGDPIDASVGDELYGYMKKYFEKYTGYYWKIKIKNFDNGDSSILYTDEFPTDGSGRHDLKIFCALEGYNVRDDDDVPGDIRFEDMIFADEDNDIINITWSGYTPGESWGLTGLRVRVYSDDSLVKLYTAN